MTCLQHLRKQRLLPQPEDERTNKQRNYLIKQIKNYLIEQTKKLFNWVEVGTLVAVNTEVHRSRTNLIYGMRWMAFVENHKSTEGGGGQGVKAMGR